MTFCLTIEEGLRIDGMGNAYKGCVVGCGLDGMLRYEIVLNTKFAEVLSVLVYLLEGIIE